MTRNANVKISNLATGIQQINLITTDIDFPTTGAVADHPMNGVILTDGMVVCLTQQSDVSQNGFCECAVFEGNYTLTPIINLAYGTTYNGGFPFLFHVSQGVTLNNLWLFYQANGGAAFLMFNP